MIAAKYRALRSRPMMRQVQELDGLETPGPDLRPTNTRTPILRAVASHYRVCVGRASKLKRDFLYSRKAYAAGNSPARSHWPLR